MADAIKLYLDLSTPQGRLVKSLKDASEFVFGPFYQFGLLPLRLYPVTPLDVIPTIGQDVDLFEKLPITNLDFWCVYGPAPGAEGILAAQYTFTKQLVPDSDGDSGYFYADFDLNTTNLNTAIGASATLTKTFEILRSRAGGAFRTCFQKDVTIKAGVKDPATVPSLPTPTLTPLSLEQARATFVPWDVRPFTEHYGRGIILASPDGAHIRESGGVSNDGVPTDYII